MRNEKARQLALSIMVLAFIAFVYGTAKAIAIVSKTQVSTHEGIYTSYVSDTQTIQNQAYALTKQCQDTRCKVQNLLNFSSNIPYKTAAFQHNSPQKTIQKNYGDCDDKSNLLISMLHALQIEAYFVLVPKHIFVITPLSDDSLSQTKGLWVNGKKYYILESTAKDSSIGFPLHYDFDEIDAIVEPFRNEKVEVRSLSYKL